MARTPSGTQWFGAWPLALAVLGLCTIFEAVSKRGIKFGTPQLWGTLILGAVTTSALTMLWITATDLFDDLRRRSRVAGVRDRLLCGRNGARVDGCLGRMGIKKGRRNSPISAGRQAASRLGS